MEICLITLLYCVCVGVSCAYVVGAYCRFVVGGCCFMFVLCLLVILLVLKLQLMA